MKFWAITMPERRHYITSHCRDHGISVDVVDAWQGPASGLTTQLCGHGADYYLSPGYIGNNISWWGALTAALAADEEVNVFLEDDCAFCPDFARKAAEYIANAPPDWDLLYLGHCCTEDKPRQRINHYWDRIEFPLCTHCLAVHRKALPALKDAARFAWRQIDMQFLELALPRLAVYTAVPNLAEQRQDFPSTVHDKKATWDSVPGWFDFTDIYEPWTQLAEGIIVELGSWLGRSAAYMAQGLKASGSAAEFYVVDTWRGSESDPGHYQEIRLVGGHLFPLWCANMAHCGVLDRITPIVGDSASAANYFDDDTIDRIFIDADHTYEAVCRDIRAWLPKMRPDAIMAGHDFERDPVHRAVLDTLTPAHEVKAISERSWICDMRPN